MTFVKFPYKKSAGVTILEILVAVAVFALMFALMTSFLSRLNYSNAKTKAAREAQENARRAMEVIFNEVRQAKSIYTPTTSLNQLSLETLKYLPPGEETAFIDFFICEQAVCLKKESQDPVAITADSVQVSLLEFTRISYGARDSVKINLAVNYKNPHNLAESYSLATLSSTVSLRSY